MSCIAATPPHTTQVLGTCNNHIAVILQFHNNTKTSSLTAHSLHTYSSSFVETHFHYTSPCPWSASESPRSIIPMDWENISPTRDDNMSLTLEPKKRSICRFAKVFLYSSENNGDYLLKVVLVGVYDKVIDRVVRYIHSIVF